MNQGAPAPSAGALRRLGALIPERGRPRLRFHLVFAPFRFAVICVGIADRIRAGMAATAKVVEVAPLARRFAVRAREAMEGAESPGLTAR